jgi:hypothetical protein
MPSSSSPSAHDGPLGVAFTAVDQTLHYHAQRLGPVLERLLSSPPLAGPDDADEDDEAVSSSTESERTLPSRSGSPDSR